MIQTKDFITHLKNITTMETKAITPSTLFNEYYNYLINFIAYKLNGNKELAIDVVGDTFEKIVKNFNSFDSTKSNAKTWVTNIAINCMIDTLRKEKQTISFEALTHEGKDDKTYFFEPKSTSQADSLINGNDTMIRVNKAVCKLSKLHKQLYKLFFVEQYTLSEIVETLNLPIGTVKAEIHRARAILQKELKNIAV